MRCQFCGWDNPQGKETCEKCNKPLVGGAPENAGAAASGQDNNGRPTSRQAAGEFNPKATVREVPLGGPSVVVNDCECPECGYHLENGECSACGYKVGAADAPKVPSSGNAGGDVLDDFFNSSFSSSSEKVAKDVRKTVRPMRKAEKEAEFKLVPISEETGMPEGKPLLFEGNAVVLNRANTDPKNSTITSQEQADITFENGKWAIEDKSEFKTTFVQAARKVELQKGDLILLGNQLYRFE